MGSGTQEIGFKPSFKSYLRKKEFSECVEEALKKIVDLICGPTTNLKNMDMALELMAEFVFFEVDRLGKKTDPLDPLRELQVAITIFLFFIDNISNELHLNTLFLSLFGGSTATARMNFLTKVVTMAVRAPSSSVLNSAGVWMQQLGNTSPNSCKLAEVIIEDYLFFYLNLNENKNILKTFLPRASPSFTANFMTASAENYFKTVHPRNEIKFPSESLLEIITSWLSNNPGICTAAQLKPAALPVGAIAMEATTPIAGLLKWCILAPIFKQNDEPYANLQLALINSISEIPRNLSSKAIYSQHLSQLISPLMHYVAALKNKQDSMILTDENLHKSLERFAQAVQVASAANAIYGHLDDLFNQLKMLPYNKLMNIVIKSYKEKVIL